MTKPTTNQIRKGVFASIMIPDNLCHENQLPSVISGFFKETAISKLLKRSNCRKEKGVSDYRVFQLLFRLVFTGKAFRRYLANNSQEEGITKDTIYRFLNSQNTNWRKFLLLLSYRIISQFVLPLISDDRIKVLIVDDSLYSRSRSKVVELLARVHDHTTNSYVKGFRMLTLGWSDGSTFLPVAFSLLSSEKEKNRLFPIRVGIDKRTNGYKRRTEALRKSTEVLLELIKQAREHHIPAKYVLFDSWFAFPVVIARIMGLGFHTVAMLKASKVFYRYQGKLLNLNDLYARVKKKRGRAKILASVQVELTQTVNGKPVLAKIVFVRDRQRSRQWLALISTDIELTDEEVVQLYGRRWNIEVFFKVAKSYLRLAKEFYSRSYDALVAHTTIVFTRYILLSLEQRRNMDVRTLGGIFYECCDELEDLRFIDALMLLIQLLRTFLQDTLFIKEAQIKNLLDDFIGSLPKFLTARLGVCNCES